MANLLKNSNYYCALSEDGFITNPLHVADYLLSNYLLSNKSQSTLYPDLVVSFGYDYAESGGRPSGLISRMEDNLYTLFNDFFYNVNISVEEPYIGSGSITALSLSIYFEDINNTAYDLSRIANIKGSKVVNISTNIASGQVNGLTNLTFVKS